MPPPGPSFRGHRSSRDGGPGGGNTSSVRTGQGRASSGVALETAPTSTSVSPQVGEARALYNMGNVYHAKGKQLSWSSAQDPGHLPPAIRETLRRASEFYE